MNLYTLFVVIALIYLHIMIVDHVHETGNTCYKDTDVEIYDLGYKYIPNLRNNVYVNVLMYYVMPIVVLCFGMDVFVEFMEYFIIIVFVRHFFNAVTIFPSIKECDDSGISKLRKYTIGHCYDKIFSGHFAITVLMALILYDKGVNKWILILLNVCNAFLILARRAHFTIDLLVSMVVVSYIYQNKLKLN